MGYSKYPIKEKSFLLVATSKNFLYLADLVFDPTLALTRVSPEDLLLSYAMITAVSAAAYVDPFARSWLGLSTTNMTLPYPTC